MYPTISSPKNSSTNSNTSLTFGERERKFVVATEKRKKYHSNSVYPIDGKTRVRVTYGHLSQVNVSEGQDVEFGDMIGRSGSTGSSTAEHLHMDFQVYDSTGNLKKQSIEDFNWSNFK